MSDEFRCDADDETVVRGTRSVWPRAEEPGFVTPLVAEREEPLLPLVADIDRSGRDYLRAGFIVEG